MFGCYDCFLFFYHLSSLFDNQTGISSILMATLNTIIASSGINPEISISGVHISEVVGVLAKTLKELLETVTVLEGKSEGRWKVIADQVSELKNELCECSSAITECGNVIELNHDMTKSDMHQLRSELESSYTQQLTEQSSSFQILNQNAIQEQQRLSQEQQRQVDDCQVMWNDQFQRQSEALIFHKENHDSQIEEFREKLHSLSMFQRKQISQLMTSHHSSVLRKDYFKKLFRNRLIKKSENRKINLCYRLGFNTDKIVLKSSFLNLMKYSQIKKRSRIKTRHLRAMYNSTTKGAIALRYRSWIEFYKKKCCQKKEKQTSYQRAVKAFMMTLREGSLRYWYRCWDIFYKTAIVRKQKKNLMQALSLGTTQSHKQSIWDKWQRYLQSHKRRLSQRDLSRAFQAATAKGIIQAYYDKLSSFLRTQRHKKKVKLTMTTLKRITENGLKEGYWGLWQKKVLIEKKKKNQVHLMSLLARSSPLNMKEVYYKKWIAAVQHHKNTKGSRLNQHSKKLEGLTRDRLQKKELMSSTFKKLIAFAKNSMSTRDAQATAENMNAIHQKTEALWAQLELHQKTVANTNSCVHRLVDKLISIDDVIDRIDKTKVNRRELRAYVDSNVFKSSNNDTNGNLDNESPSVTPKKASLPPPPPAPRVAKSDVAHAQASAARLSAMALAAEISSIQSTPLTVNSSRVPVPSPQILPSSATEQRYRELKKSVSSISSSATRKI